MTPISAQLRIDIMIFVYRAFLFQIIYRTANLVKDRDGPIAWIPRCRIDMFGSAYIISHGLQRFDESSL
jgi:hypothetical protein